jgi:hypothetical protein
MNRFICVPHGRLPTRLSQKEDDPRLFETMPIPVTSHRLLPSALLLGCAATLLAVVDSQCTLCQDGSAIDPTGMIGGTSCTDIDSVIGATEPTSSTCIEAQLQGYLNCACPTFPDAYCAMCADGFFDIPSPRKKIAFTDETCESVLFVKETELATCQDITKYASWCGCPGAPSAPGTCMLCDPGMELITDPSMVVDDDGTTCQAAFDYAPFVTSDTECANVVQPVAAMCCVPSTMSPTFAPGSTRGPTLVPSYAPTPTPSTSTPSKSPVDAPTGAPSPVDSGVSTMTSSSRLWVVTAVLGAIVAAFL